MKSWSRIERDLVEFRKTLLKIELLDALLELLLEIHAGPLTNSIHVLPMRYSWMSACKCLEVDHGELQLDRLQMTAS